ncbi:DUF2165 family protein [Serratia sp. DD3]|uniref:DUF2165 family protein n=1 Tax=Serratia sp. DD3 TaxID=1410619 RepID=UPI0003C5150D|nr:DUF2165 family protein [Serratia sp. DD3]KEY60821.1 hypothetical protein SRDD_02000 [Serratia sp. DD3]
MEFKKVARWSIIAMAMFPTLWGLLALLNNTSGFSGTVQYAVAPMLAMTDTYGNPAQTWRAIDSLLAAQIGLVLITATEALAGILGLLAMVKMVSAINAPYSAFERGKAYLLASCVLAVLVWGVGFAVIAGDYFLAWQSKTTLATQVGGLIYAIPCFLTLILALVHKE